MKVKCIFTNKYGGPLETKINNWIDQNKDKVEIIDIKFVTLSTAYILYKDK